MTPEFARILAAYDQHRALLREALTILSSGNLTAFLAEAERVMADPRAEPQDRLMANAMLVGALGVMLEDMGHAPA